LNALKDVNFPPDRDIINTPRSSNFTFTNRVTIQFENADPGLDANNPWLPVPMTPRARMEAGLNKWLGNVLGKPEDIMYRVAQLDDDGIESDSSNMEVADLALQPIDLVYITGNELNTGTPGKDKEARTAASELESRIAYQYRHEHNLDDEVVVRIEFMKPEIDGKKTFGHLLPLLRMLKSVITDARPLHAEDFDPPSKTSLVDTDNPEGYDVENLQNRIEMASMQFETYLNELGDIEIDADVEDKDMEGIFHNYTTLKDTFAALAEIKSGFGDITFTFSTANAILLQGLLLRISGFGLPDAFPQLISVDNDKDKVILLDQARSVARRAGEAGSIAADLSVKAAASTVVQMKVNKYIAAGKAFFGDVFNIIPLFTYSNEADIQQSNTDRVQLLKHAADNLNMTYVADEWLQNVSHVRPKLARWDYIRMLMESLNTVSPELKPVQLPYRARDSWLAVEFPKTYEVINENGETTSEPFNIAHDTLSVVIHGDAAFKPSAKQSGLLVDDWTEVIPTKEEITGITFNYNQPNACPPQALLLAVTPREKGHWTWDDLVGILNDTLQRVKGRAVEPIKLDKTGLSELNVLLPAIVSDFSQYDLNVSLDYRMNLAFVAQTLPVVSVNAVVLDND
jgi:hypothetical protein